MNGIPRRRVMGLRLGAILSTLAIACSPQVVHALNAQVSWTGIPGAAGYKIYVRQDGQPYSFGTDVGLATTEPDGLISSVVPGLAFNVTNWFALTSYNASRAESALSNELSLFVPALGSPTPVVLSTPSAQGTPAATLTQPPTITLDIGGPLGPYLCYKAWRTAGTMPFAQQTLSLHDQFENTNAMVVMPIALCAPASDDGPGIPDPATHLEAYRIRPAAPSVSQRDLRMTDEFGTLVVNASRPDRLLVPTSKGLGIVPSPPSPVTDQFKCYNVTVSPGTPKFQTGRLVAIVDQLGRRLYDLKRPTRMCVPVDDNGRGISDPLARVMCYKITPARAQSRQAMILGQIRTLNQFGPGSVNTGGEEELCVPAAQTP